MARPLTVKLRRWLSTNRESHGCRRGGHGLVIVIGRISSLLSYRVQSRHNGDTIENNSW
jgi:hypothetical protein